jgi:hypothetical protein
MRDANAPLNTAFGREKWSLQPVGGHLREGTSPVLAALR